MLRVVPQEIRYVTYEELADIMRCSVKTIERMKKAGMPFEDWGRRRVVFDPDKALRWAQNQKRAA